MAKKNDAPYSFIEVLTKSKGGGKGEIQKRGFWVVSQRFTRKGWLSMGMRRR